jgi:hypothetical protein
MHEIGMISLFFSQENDFEPFGNCGFKKLRFEKAEKCLFKSQAMWCFFENAVFLKANLRF